MINIKKVVAKLDGYDICDEFNLGTYELKDKKKLLEIVLMFYFKNQDELEEKDKEIERLNHECDTYLKIATKRKNIIDKAINILELSSQNKGICTRPETDTIQSALNILKGSKEK